jgi:AraC-like DNA-binding protein
VISSRNFLQDGVVDFMHIPYRCMWEIVLLVIRRRNTMKPMGHVVFWRNSQIKGLECCRVAHSGHTFPNHAHDAIYAFGVMEKGASYCLGRNTDAVAEPGKLVLINPGQVHSGVPVADARITYRMVYVDADLMNALAGDLRGQADPLPEFKRMVVPDRQMVGMLTHLCRLMELSDDALETGFSDQSHFTRTFRQMTGATPGQYLSV